MRYRYPGIERWCSYLAEGMQIEGVIHQHSPCGGTGRERQVASFRTQRESTNTWTDLTHVDSPVSHWGVSLVRLGPTCRVGARFQRLQQLKVREVVDEGLALEQHHEALMVHPHTTDGGHKVDVGGGGTPGLTAAGGVQQTQAPRRQSWLRGQNKIGSKK